jgi:hypothetical protein
MARTPKAFCGLAAYGGKANEVKAPSDSAGVAPDDEWARRARRGVAEAGGGGLLLIISASRFRERLSRHWRHVLRWRSQRSTLDWDRLRPIFDRWIPRPRTLLHIPT